MAPLSFTELLDGIAASHMDTEPISSSKGRPQRQGVHPTSCYVSHKVVSSCSRPVAKAPVQIAGRSQSSSSTASYCDLNSSSLQNFLPKSAGGSAAQTAVPSAVTPEATSSSSIPSDVISSSAPVEIALAKKVCSFEHTVLPSSRSTDADAEGSSYLSLHEVKGPVEPGRDPVASLLPGEQQLVPLVLEGSSFLGHEENVRMPTQSDMSSSDSTATGFVDQLFRDVEMPAHAPWMVQALLRGQAGEPTLESSPRSRDATAQRSRESIPEKGIPAELLLQWPAVRQRDGIRDSETCAVCLERLRRGQEVRRLPCSHPYHRSCIDPWLRSSTLCPCCKSDVLPALQTRLAQASWSSLLG